MKDYRVGTRYAQALAALTEKENQLDRMEKELAGAVELVKRHPEISHLLMNATISREEKEDFIEKILPKDSSHLLVNFLKVLIKKRRFQDLALIREQFHRLFEEKKGIQRVRVQAPIPLSEILQERLRRVLEKKLNRKVYLEAAHDPEILGGLILDFDGTRMDGSFRTQLAELKQRLLEPYA